MWDFLYLCGALEKSMKEYRFRISGVHYAANPEAETLGLPDTEEMHVRTRELLRKIDRERPLVSLFAEPSNLFNPDCIMAFSKGNRIGRVADECVSEVMSLLAQSEDPILFARIEDVAIRQHGHLTVVVEAEELTDILPLQSSAIEWGMWLRDDMMRLSPHKLVLAEKEAYYILKKHLMTNIDEADITDLKIYLGLWLEGSCHDLSRESREARSQFIAQLEKAQNKDVRLLSEQLKQQRTSICGRMALTERASEWWTERLESEEMQRLWMQWWLANEGLLWGGLRDIDEKLRQLPGQLYNDIGKRDVVLSRLYYMNTPRKALDAILTLLMLRELTCRQLDIEMKPMIESEYGSDKVVEECGETYTESPIYLSTAKGQKIDLIRVLNVMYEQGRFTGKDGSKLTKKEFFIEAGRTFNVDLSSYDKDLSRSMSDSTKLEKHLKPFEDMKLKMIEIWNSK